MFLKTRYVINIDHKQYFYSNLLHKFTLHKNIHHSTRLVVYILIQ